MATLTRVPLAYIEISSATASVTFGNIPNTFRDLEISVVGTVNTAAEIGVNYNGGGGTYNYQRLYAGAPTASGVFGVNRFASIYTQGTIIKLTVFDYAKTDKNKTSLSQMGDASNFPFTGAHEWESTAAITSLEIAPESASFQAGSKLALFGVHG